MILTVAHISYCIFMEKKSPPGQKNRNVSLISVESGILLGVELIKVRKRAEMMTKILLKLFVKNYQDTKNGKVRTAVGSLSGGVGIFCNVLLCAMKIFVGVISGAVSILADAMNNLTDATSAVVTLIGFKLAEKPADEDHPYGHARYEYLSGLAVAALIIIIGFELAKTSAEKILSPSPVDISLPALLVLVGAIGVKLWLFLFNRKLGKLIGSSTLLATAADSRNDCVATGAVLVAALLQWQFSWQVDGFMGLAVALFILYSGWGLAKQTISPLLGEAADPVLAERIVETLRSDERILGYHDLMVHDYGPGQRFASIHVEMDRNEDPLLCHEIIDNMERVCLKKHNIHLVIHYDPVVTDDPALEKARELVTQLLRQQDTRLSVHDFRMVSAGGHTNLIFDVALPQDLQSSQKEIKKSLDTALAETGETYYTVVTFDPESFNRHSG